MLRVWANVFKPLSSNSGQGVIEYILVLVVTVGIILGLIYQLNDAFKVYAQNYFGDYFACLLETGELPSIGGEPDPNGICNGLFQEFSLERGKPLVGSGYNGGGGSGGTNPPAPAESRSSSRSSEGGSSGGAQYVAINSRAPSSGRFSGPPKSGGAWDKGLDARKKSSTYTGSTDSSVPNGALGRGGRGNGQSNIDGTFYVEHRTTKEEGENNRGLAVRSSIDTKAKKEDRLKVNRKLAKIDEMAPDGEFTIGNFLRILLIIAIIIAMIVFLGGQALQISKSMD